MYGGKLPRKLTHVVVVAEAVVCLAVRMPEGFLLTGGKGPRFRRRRSALVCLEERPAASTHEVAMKMVAKRARRAQRERVCCIVERMEWIKRVMMCRKE